MLCQIGIGLIRDLVHLAARDQHVLGPALDTSDRALLIGNLPVALADGLRLVFRSTEAVADLAVPGLLGCKRRPDREKDCRSCQRD